MFLMVMFFSLAAKSCILFTYSPIGCILLFSAL